MDRRFFLKAVAALIAAPDIEIPSFRIITPDAPLLLNESWFSTVREMRAFDIFSDLIFYRWDLMGLTVTGAPVQLMVDLRLLGENSETLLEARAKAATLLAEGMRQEGIDPRSLVPLPIPVGFGGRA